MSQEICNISNSSLEKSSVDEKQLSTLDNGDPLALPANIPDNMVYKWLAWYEEGRDGHGGDSYNHKRMMMAFMALFRLLGIRNMSLPVHLRTKMSFIEVQWF